MKKPEFNGKYDGENLNYISFPLGGMGAGMFSIQGTGMLGEFSLRNSPDLTCEPNIYASLSVKNRSGEKRTVRVIEGQIPRRKIFGVYAHEYEGAGNGLQGKNYGLPRFKYASFKQSFPFAEITLKDGSIPLDASIVAWSPFTPPDANDSSYPIAVLEYTFTNKNNENVDAVFYFSSMNFMKLDDTASVYRYKNGFVLRQPAMDENRYREGAFGAYIDDENTKINTAFFRGGWFDTVTMLLNEMEEGYSEDRVYDDGSLSSPGASASVKFNLEPYGKKTIRVLCCWYVPESNLTYGALDKPKSSGCIKSCNETDTFYKPWYNGKFAAIEDVMDYAIKNADRLRNESRLFSDAFSRMDLPGEIIEAVSANLSILKSPTILRQQDGRLWGWEGCFEQGGCCPGSCTHVYNYAQAICHLFPSLERTLRKTEFCECQNADGHQRFRSPIPIQKSKHNFHAASDGQLGGIIKLYRDFLICGDIGFLKKYYEKAKSSLDYCINIWDPDRLGVLIEPHHNTYDIEFWGPDPMCSTFYLGALRAFCEIGTLLNKDISEYEKLCLSGKNYLENNLFNGEYFFQDVKWEGLGASLPELGGTNLSDSQMSLDTIALMKTEGPKYQYGAGCLSDAVIGCWMAKFAGLGNIIDTEKTVSTLKAIHKYNLKHDLREHANPQRPGYAIGNEGGLLLCTWPNGNRPKLPFVYSDEVWTGIEYQAASHMISMGLIKEGLEVVRECRKRYDGAKRNPFDEYECGHWYARAMASYSLIEAYTGARYDAYSKTLYVNPPSKKAFTSFIATAGGFGVVRFNGHKAVLSVMKGNIEVNEILIS